MDTILNLIYFIIVIGVLVLIHEFGHFIAARMSGMRVDIFSVGMGFRLFGWNKKSGFTVGKLPEDYEFEGHTDYRLAVFPIGGFVKIVGMVDESFDTNFANTEPQPWEFRSKNTFQKAFAISAGVLMNFLFAIIVFASISFFNGRDNWATTEVGYVKNESIGQEIGIKQGDKILKVNDTDIKDWNAFVNMLAMDDLGQSCTIRLMRDKKEINVHVDGEDILAAIAGKKVMGIYPTDVTTRLLSVQTLKPAGKIGLKPDDIILAINNNKLDHYTEFMDIMSANPSKPVFIQWQRGAEIMSDSLTPTEKGIAGVILDRENSYMGAISHVEFGLLESIGIGFSDTYKSIDLFFSSIGQIIFGPLKFKENIGGPVKIAQMASKQAEQGFLPFLHFIALLSVTLGIINILPFPALDGGHLIFIIVEGIIRREVPVKVKMAFQQFGLVVLLLLMAFVLYNDLT